MDVTKEKEWNVDSGTASCLSPVNLQTQGSAIISDFDFYQPRLSPYSEVWLTKLFEVMETIQEIDSYQELKVTFYPELFLQRRIWILNILREENITKVCQLVLRLQTKYILCLLYTDHPEY